MNVLLIGSGGREHAIAHSLLSSPLMELLFVAPGNAGTEAHNVVLDVGDHEAVKEFVRDHHVDLVVIGPEAPMAEGLTDELIGVGVKVFGPTKAAARLEWSKTFTREFAHELGIPSPRHASFDDLQQALSYLDAVDFEIVVKADGLAAGKGVIIPESAAEAREAVNKLMARTGSLVVLEERLVGEEVSLLGFCDGESVVAMPPAQDHKRALDGDLGPNTGGMGAFAPSPRVSPGAIHDLAKQFLVVAADGMAAAGSRFVGVLYAGLILTADGPRLLEYNCRFGDPEAQVILSLLESDLLGVMKACVDGTLSQEQVRWKDAAAGTVVLASGGYPGPYETGIEIVGLGQVEVLDGVTAYHAGTRRVGEQVETAGGRVLAITAVADDLAQAMRNAYAAARQVTFDGMHYRSDIGGSFVDAYASAGVDIAAGAVAVEGIADVVRSTYDERVLRGIGAFGGAISATHLKAMDAPVLIASTDGVGTKTLVAELVDKWDGIGQDIVNHGVNDVLVQGAQPLFFLDGIAAAKMDPGIVARIVTGMAMACRENGIVLLGGETAEMPGVLADGAWDVTGTLVGSVDESALLPRCDVVVGDVLIGLASTGLHTNGYTLARQQLAVAGAEARVPGSELGLGDSLLVPHRSYLSALKGVLEADLVKALVHVTGGGLVENTPRVLGDGIGAVIDTSSWPTPPLFSYLVDALNIDSQQAYRVFNMGIGMVVVAAVPDVARVRELIDEPTWIIGELVVGDTEVTLR
ncbi:MAG: phosphoribosylamine--glycine ligase [Acidimicrobiales bacterium]